MMKKVFVLMMVGIFALCACDNKNEDVAVEKPTIKIGAIYPMSGDGAIYGEAAKEAVKLFFEDFNKKESHFNYEVIFEDNQLKPAQNAVLAKKLIDLDKVDVLVTCLSNFGMVVSPIAEAHKTLHFSIATDPNVAKGFYNFMASSNVESEVKVLYDELLKNNAATVDIVLVNATGAVTMMDYFKDIAAKEKQLSIDNIYNVNADEKDYRTIIAKIKQNKPDYVIVMLQMPGIDIFLKQYKEAGVNIPFTGIETFSYLQNKKLAEGMWYIDAAIATDAFEHKYKNFTKRETTDYAEYMDMILQIVTNAYEKTGGTDKVKVGEYILQNSNGIETAIGKVSTMGDDGLIAGEPILRKVENGKLITVN